MTDRELLELAAKAAGYWNTEFDTWSGAPSLNWNPLTDDGDALRLAVKLYLTVSSCSGVVIVERPDVDHEGLDYPTFAERVADDAMAATRRAIVRAAAEIGETI